MKELRTLIDVSAGVRLPQYEPEIFSDKELTEYYLHKLCEGKNWKSGVSTPKMVYYYANYVMKSRWPEAEHIIVADAIYRKWYNYVLGTNI